jgi:N-acetylglucosaminyldiphosphoundecaprenol N-acetyl-beta-D-mannosaminyltransferase
MHGSIRPPGQTRENVPLRENVLGVPVDVLSWTEAIDLIFEWALRRESRTICMCNAHSIMTARSDAAHTDAIKSADLVAPDGAPVARMLRKKGHLDQERISGSDFMWACCRKASMVGTETRKTLRSLT